MLFSGIKCKKRLVAILILAIIVFVTLFSSYYLAREADHDCSDPTCVICATIGLCRNNLRQLSLGQTRLLTAIIAVCFARLVFFPFLSTLPLKH